MNRIARFLLTRPFARRKATGGRTASCFRPRLTALEARDVPSAPSAGTVVFERTYTISYANTYLYDPGDPGLGGNGFTVSNNVKVSNGLSGGYQWEYAVQGASVISVKS
jgi:hypothetical protein